MSEVTSSPSTQVSKRVQIRLRGMRFETTVDILTSYCGTFRRLFDTNMPPLSLLLEQDRPGDLSSSDTNAGTPDDALQVAFYRSLPSDTPFQPPIRQAVILTADANSPIGPLERYWYFDFSVLKGVEEAAGTVMAPKNELQPEFAGSIFVFLRKLYAANGDVTKVKFSARWNEMPYDQQRSLSDIVNVLDIQPLKDLGYGKPTAEPVTSHIATPSDASPSSVLRGGGDVEDIPLVDRAKMYMQIHQQIHQPVGSKGPHPSVDDDALELPATGCAKCGVSGHSTEECKY